MSNRRATRFDSGREANALFLERSISASVVIDKNREIVHFRGNSSSYLSHLSGKASFRMLYMAQPGLVRGLHTPLAHTKKEGRSAKKAGLAWQHEGQQRRVTIEVILLPTPLSAGSASFFLILFTTQPPPLDHLTRHKSQMPLLHQEENADEKDSHARGPESPESRVEALFFPGPLQAQNEEILAIAEDLQVPSEEFQSTGEELTWVNQKSQARNEQRKTAYDYATALAETRWNPLLILNNRLQAIQATQAFFLLLHTTAEATGHDAFARLGDGQWHILSLLKRLDEIRPANQGLAHSEVNHTFSVIGHKRIILNARSILWREHETPLILLIFADVTNCGLEKPHQQFLGLATHERKTPLTGLKAFTEFLPLTIEQVGDSQSAHMLDNIDDQSHEAGRFRIHRTWVSLQEIVHACVGRLQRATSMHDIRIAHETSHQIYADRLHARQILLNVLSHALKYAPPVRCIFVTIDTSLDGVVLSIQDSGRGIAPEQRQNLSGRFFRVSGDTMETYPGLGLGLYIATQIVNQHGGHIWVESEEGH
jgi:two-component system CheB/CheR fusion protein